MIRIGFDPIMEAEQHNKQLLKQAEYDRMVKEARTGSQLNSATGSKLLALLGLQMAWVGLHLAERYGNKSRVSADFASHYPGICG